jgi:hypothetical protein
METSSIEQPVTSPEGRGNATPSYVRITVINNSQIIASVFRAMAVVGMLAGATGASYGALSPGKFRDLLGTVGICLLTIGVAFMIVGHFLDRALRRCPVCQTRITRATEEKRHCLECGTELWNYWDE